MGVPEYRGMVQGEGEGEYGKWKKGERRREQSVLS